MTTGSGAVEVMVGLVTTVVVVGVVVVGVVAVVVVVGVVVVVPVVVVVVVPVSDLGLLWPNIRRRVAFRPFSSNAAALSGVLEVLALVAAVPPRIARSTPLQGKRSQAKR